MSANRRVYVTQQTGICDPAGRVVLGESSEGMARMGRGIGPQGARSGLAGG